KSMHKQIAAVLLAGILAAASLFGQTSDGNIVGTVLDASGGAIPNAAVALTNVDTGVKTLTSTGETGGYRFGNVLVGRYNVTVSANGFTTMTLKEVAVELNKTTTANIKLEVGVVATAVDVVAASTFIDTSTAQLSNNYGARF